MPVMLPAHWHLPASVCGYFTMATVVLFIPFRAQITINHALLVALLAITFNIVNATFNGLALFFWQPGEAATLNLGLTSLAGLFRFRYGI